MVNTKILNMKLRTLAITIGAFLLSLSLSAQTAAEIEMAKKMARAQGYSEAEINAMIQKQKSGNSTVNTTVTATPVDRTPAQFVTETATETLELSDIYGHAIFQSQNMNFVPSYNIPTPANYKLAAGDEIVIDIWGAVYQNMTQEISPEGSITVPDLGPIYLAGQTIEQAEKNLKIQLGRIYSGITAEEPTTFIRLSLGRIRSFAINVVGDVVNPGTYTLPSLSTISSALYLAGGPTKIGSVRNIKVYRDNKLVNTFDLYKFMLDGDFASNVRLEDNDLIKVNPYSSLVKIAGQVKHNATYTGAYFKPMIKQQCHSQYTAFGYSALTVNIVQPERKNGCTANQ